MDHQSELEKTKYRNWVRGGLAYKYLKSGVESFVDEIVQQEHNRILRDIKYTPGLTCSRCSIKTLKPLHKSKKHPVTTGKYICPKGQTKCNCLFPKKEKCRNKICDAIFEEILNSHGSTPPAPNWKNTNIQNWCSMPWEIAKCFINSPGYSDKVSASDTDVSGLLHVLINNINLHDHFSVNVDGNDVFSKAIEGRNMIFHSPAMELEDHKVNEYIDNIIAILEDEKELKSKEDSKQAVVKLKQLQDTRFVITTHDEVEVCKDAMASFNNRSEELEQMIRDAKDEIDAKQTNALKVFEDRSEKAPADALDKLNERNEVLQTVKITVEELKDRIRQLELITDETKADNILHKHSQYLKQKKVFQEKLITLYEEHYVKTWISPFNIQDNEVNINEVYVKPNMIVEETTDEEVGTPSTMENKGIRQAQSVDIGTESNPTGGRKNTKRIRDIDTYQDIFHTNGITHKKIYITGEVGTGKSSLSKMMIFNWCKAFKALKDKDKDVEQMRKFDFLFFIPLQTMSGLSNDIKGMIKDYYKDYISEELIEKIIDQDGERCLIIADGLDEWTPPLIKKVQPHHVSFGIPIGDGMRNATFITLSRPSAKGILKMKSTEFDQKIVLLGIKQDSKTDFNRKYMSKLNKNEDTLNEFIKKVKKSNLQHLERTPFLLQQLIWMYSEASGIGESVSDIFSHIINIIFRWCEDKDEQQRKKNANTDYDTKETPEEFKQMQLPEMLRRFDRCQTNERLIFLLSKFSIFALTDEIIRSTFGRRELLKFGIIEADIAMFLKLGILVEYNRFDQTYEKTYLSFVHISYLEFFAAVYISSHCTEQTKLSETILEKLFIKFKSADDILQSSNLLQMVCGLSPFLTGEISKRISKIVRQDNGMIEYRKNPHELESRRFYFLWNESVQRALQIQKLMSSCLSECGSDVPTKISLCDILITDETDVALIQKCVPDDVKSLAIIMEKLPTVNDSLKGIAQFSKLEFICFCGTFSYNSKELMALVNVNVKTLSLINMPRFSSFSDPTPQIFNLSKYSQLQNIHLENVWCTIGSGVKNLKSLYFSGSRYSIIDHEVKAQFQSSLKQTVKHAVFLRHLTLKDYCESEILDLSKHSQLQSIYLEGYVCTLGSDVTNLEHIYISVPPLYNAMHGICEQLLSSLAKAISLKHLHLECIWCDDSTYKGHTIDLSGHVQLQNIRLDGFFCTFGSDLKNLETVHISGIYDAQIPHEFCEQLSSALGKAVSLKQLYLQNIECNDAACEGHSIDLSGLVQLQNIDFYECTFILNNAEGAKNLKTVHISGSYIADNHISHEICEQLSSALGKAVSLKQLYLVNIECNDAACEGHSIDLSGLVQLQNINFHRCTFILNNAQGAKNLETVYISERYDKQIPHGFCEQLLSALGKAVSLKQLYLGNIKCNDAACEGHSIDLSGLVQLQTIRFYGCTLILNNAQGAKNFETFDHFYRRSERGNDHRLEGLLLESLLQAVSLKHLKLDYSNLRNGLTVDLSKFDQLQSIELKGQILVPGLSTQSLQKIEVEDFSDVEKLIYLCSGSDLKELHIGGKLGYFDRNEYEIFTSGTNSRIQNLEHLESLKLIKLYIDDENALTVSPRMQHISQIMLNGVKMSLDAWRKFVDSLLTLKQSVDVSYDEMLILTDIDTTFMQIALEYVKKNAPVFEVNEEESDSFNFTKH